MHPSIYLRRQRLYFPSLAIRTYVFEFICEVFIVAISKKTMARIQWDVSKQIGVWVLANELLIPRPRTMTAFWLASWEPPIRFLRRLRSRRRIRWMHICQRDVLHCQIDWTLITNVRPFGNTLRIIRWSSKIYGLTHFHCNNPFNFRHVRNQNINDSRHHSESETGERNWLTKIKRNFRKTMLMSLFIRSRPSLLFRNRKR